MFDDGRARKEKEGAMVVELSHFWAGMTLDARLACIEDELLVSPQFGPLKGSINRLPDMPFD